MNTGIYKIENIVNGKFYIGSTASLGFEKRWKSHRNLLLTNKHQNQHLQSSWNKYGEKNFKFDVVEVCDKKYCIIREQYYIDSLHPQYNILQTAGSTFGYKHTNATKLLIGAASSGNKNYGYLGEYIFYNPRYGYFVGSFVIFSKKFNIRQNIGYKLKSGALDKSHGWIFIGKSGDEIPENIYEIYYNKLYNGKKSYSFYHKDKGIFTGTIPDFIKTNKIKATNQSTIKRLVNGERKMAWGWIFLCEGKNITENIETLYSSALEQNTKEKSRMNNVYTFINGDQTFSGTINQFIVTHKLNNECVRRIITGERKQYRGWTIKT